MASMRCASVDARAAPARGRRADRPERRRQDDLVNVLTGFDFPTAGTSSSAGVTSRRWTPAPARAAPGSPARSSTAARSRSSPSARTSRSPRSACGAGPREARRRADELLELLGLSARAEQPAGSLAHGDERQARRRARARDRAAVPAARRAGGGPAGGGGARVRRRRPLGARRARGGRAADRPQHGARDGGVRPDPRPRPGAHARRGHPRRRSAANLDVAAAYLGEAPGGGR